MPWKDYDKEAEYEEHFGRLCTAHEMLFEDRCPVGDHLVKEWEVVDLKTGRSYFLVKDGLGPIRRVKVARPWLIGKEFLGEDLT